MKKAFILLLGLFLSQSLLSQADTEVITVRKENNTIYTVAEVPPTFKGGEIEFFNFLNKYISYPDSLKNSIVNGKVFCKFVVEKDGSITNIEIVRSPHPLLSEEVLQAMRKMPKWNPGLQYGKPVRVQFVVPVQFNLR